MEVNTLPETGFVRIKQILTVIPVSRATWWKGVRAGRFPRAIKMGSCTFWKAEDIRELIQKIGEETQ